MQRLAYLLNQGFHDWSGLGKSWMLKRDMMWTGHFQGLDYPTDWKMRLFRQEFGQISNYLVFSGSFETLTVCTRLRATTEYRLCVGFSHANPVPLLSYVTSRSLRVFLPLLLTISFIVTRLTNHWKLDLPGSYLRYSIDNGSPHFGVLVRFDGQILLVGSDKPYVSATPCRRNFLLEIHERPVDERDMRDILIGIVYQRVQNADWPCKFPLAISSKLSHLLKNH